MVNIRVQKGPESPRTMEVGEIDTRAPFQSVKAAVSLFGEVAVSRQRSTPRRSRLSSEVINPKTTTLIIKFDQERIVYIMVGHTIDALNDKNTCNMSLETCFGNGLY